MSMSMGALGSEGTHRALGSEVAMSPLDCLSWTLWGVVSCTLCLASRVVFFPGLGND